MINDRVNGKTAVFGVIGDPIEHTFSPCIQNTFADILGKNIIYTALHVMTGNLGDAIKGAYALGICGLNVTVPHKKEVIKYLCDIDKRAEAIGAVNTLKYTENGYVGCNTDIIGIDYSLKIRNTDIKGKKVLLLGAGGSACAAAVFAASGGAEKITIANRTQSRARELAEHTNKYYKADIEAIGLDEIGKNDSYDIVFNTTTVGFGKMEGMSPIEDEGFFERKKVSLAFDTIYIPWKTKFISDAEKAGVTAVNGFDMLIFQAAAAQEIWFDEKYDMGKIKNIRDELEKYYRNTLTDRI